MRAIFKIQRPITSTESDPPVLIYDETREINGLFPFEVVEQFFPNNEYKVYVWGYFDEETGHLVLDDQVTEPQYW